MSVTLTPWSEDVTHVRLANDRLRLGLLTRGATVQSLQTRSDDRDPCDGEWVELVLGFDGLAPYLGDHPFLGATVGRYANRIAGARFDLDGTEHRLPANDGPNTLHGGPDHFGRRSWQLVAYDDDSATLRLVSPAGDMGFPGRLEVTTVFRVAGCAVTQETTATTDAPTVVNLTNHAYFNLHGSARRPVDDHTLRVPAGCYLAVDATGIPLPGPPTCVAGTPFDVRAGRPVGDARYDHTFVLDGPVAPVELSAGGRTLVVTTSEPGVQVYTGDHLGEGGTLIDRAGVPLQPRSGICLETQHFPDSPHRDDYPGTVLRPGATYRTWTRWELRAAARA